MGGKSTGNGYFSGMIGTFYEVNDNQRLSKMLWRIMPGGISYSPQPTEFDFKEIQGNLAKLFGFFDSGYPLGKSYVANLAVHAQKALVGPAAY
jgi:hypothetical protein